MTPTQFSKLGTKAKWWTLIALAFGLSSCGENEIRSAKEPKFKFSMIVQEPQRTAHHENDGHDHSAHAEHDDHAGHDHPKLPFSFDMPKGWSEGKGSSMRLLTIKTIDGPEVTVVRLGKNFGDMSSNINRWLGQLEAEKLSAEQIAKLTQKKSIGGIEAKLYPLEGPKKSMRIAILTKGQSSFFFKIMGDKQAVAKQGQAFNAFLDSIKFL